MKSLVEALELTENDIVRDSCIQRFEYTYELAFKMMRRCLENLSSNPQELDQMSFKEMLRKSRETALIENVEAWFEYREARNMTSHAYDLSKAEAVYALLPRFVQDARSLLIQLQNRVSRD